MATQLASIVIAAPQKLLAPQNGNVVFGAAFPVVFHPSFGVSSTGIDLALFTPAVAGVSGEYAIPPVELTGNAYARLTVPLSSLVLSTDCRTVSNTVALSFTAASGAWLAAHSVNVYPAGGTTLLASGVLAVDITLANLDVFSFAIGAFVMKCNL